MDVFVFAFNGMTGVPNKMKCSKKLATISIINKVLLPFRFFHRFKMMAVKLWTKVADTPRTTVVLIFFTHLEMVGPFE